MPLYEEYDRYYAETQRGQGIVLRDADETIQSKLPVEGGELAVTQSRLYLATGERREDTPNIRLERSSPRTYPDEGYLEIAPRMGALLSKGQTGSEFLGIVNDLRDRALERLDSRRRDSSDGMRRLYDAILAKAAAHGEAGDRRKMKDTLQSLRAAVPDRPEAAERLGEAYLAEGNARAAIVWLAAAGSFDERFDRALGRVERPRLPSRELPPPEWWIDRRLSPLLDLPEGPSDEQRARIRAASRRIAEHREAAGKAGPLVWGPFAVAVLLWIALLYMAPWVTLGVTAAAAVAVGTFTAWKSRARRRFKS